MRPSAYRRFMLFGLACAVGGGIATIAGAILDPSAFFPAWLAAFCYWLSVPLGALALLMIHNLTGGHRRYEPVEREFVTMTSSAASKAPAAPCARFPRC